MAGEKLQIKLEVISDQLTGKIAMQENVLQLYRTPELFCFEFGSKIGELIVGESYKQP